MLEKSEIRFLPLGARRVADEIRGDGRPLVAPAWWVSHLELTCRARAFGDSGKESRMATHWSVTTGSASACRTARGQIPI